MKTPKPETVKVICDTCGLDWSLHGEKPTLEKCVELLKVELAKPRPITQPYIPWAPQPLYPYRPYIQGPNTTPRPLGPYFGNPINTASAANSTGAVTYRFIL